MEAIQASGAKEVVLLFRKKEKGTGLFSGKNRDRARRKKAGIKG